MRSVGSGGVGVGLGQTVLENQHDASPEWYLMVWLVTDGETATAIQEQYVP